MEDDRLDCGWCGSARSIEYGICQVCLMEYAVDTAVLTFPLERADQLRTPPRKLDPVPEEQIAT
jgi:hypothetical protein